VEISGNICPGDDLSFECTVYGGTGTVWQLGNVNCEDKGTQDEITLLHNYTKFTQIRTCNNGAIVVQGIDAVNSSYTSQLNITVTYDMVGKTIECSNSDSATSVGSYTVSFLTPGIAPNPS
jgi:hypothetical protein